MKKAFLISVVSVMAIMLASASASAQFLEVGDYLGKFADWGNFLDAEGTPLPVVQSDGDGGWLPPFIDTADGETLLEGIQDITVFRATTLYSPAVELASNVVYPDPYTPSAFQPELIGLFYDLTVVNATATRAPGTEGTADPGKWTVDLGATGNMAVEGSGYTGGRVDIWLRFRADAASGLPTSFTPAGAGGYPSDWTIADTSGYAAGWDDYPFDAGEYDTFPTATPSSYYADGFLYVPLISGTLVDPYGDGVLLQLDLDYWTGTGDNANLGYIHVLWYNEALIAPFDSQYLNGLAEIVFFNNFEWYRFDGQSQQVELEPVFDDPTTSTVYWDTHSEDPIRFRLLPEPSSIALLSTGLVGLIGGYIRRRRK